MKKFFFSLAVFVMALCANAQTNQYFWFNGNLMMGNPIAQIDSVTFGENEPTDTLHILLPRTIIKEVHDTVYITIHDTVCPNDILEGALSGEFSVSATKKVRFSKGNLQYQASTDTWRFAERQWDFVGDAILGTVYENDIKCNNYLISNSYNGWIDLFGWGTGNNPTQYDLSADYSTFIDWGNNNISNSQSNVNWRTLSAEEYEYLLYERENASSLNGYSHINDSYGFVLLPDNWEGGLIQDNYSLEEWAVQEQQGAIFFPVFDSRIEQGVDYESTGGYYWSSTPSSSSYYAATLRLWTSNFVDVNYDDVRAYGRFVRLVQDIEE